jgi:hypothetical protein
MTGEKRRNGDGPLERRLHPYYLDEVYLGDFEMFVCSSCGHAEYGLETRAAIQVAAGE